MTGTWIDDWAMAGQDRPWSGITGGFSYPTKSPVLNLDDDTMMDKLVARMMIHTQKVIIPCKFCGSHNAFSNPTCVQCGGPLGG